MGSYSLTDLRRSVLRQRIRGFRLATTGVRADEVQTLTMSTVGGAATGGTFTITYSGQTTGTIAYNANAATVQAALEALSNLAAGDVTVTGSGPWVVTFSGTLAGTDVAAMTTNAALVTGPGSPYTLAVAETQKGGYVGTVIGTEPRQKRMVLSSDWTDQSVGAETEQAMESTRYDNAWIYLPGTGEQRRIPAGGYLGAELASEISTQALLTSTYTGAVVVSRPFANVVAANQAVELSTRLPILDDLDLTGVHRMINKALGIMMTPKRITLTGVADQQAYSLASYPWLTRQDQLIRVLADEDTAGVEPLPLPGAHSIRKDGQTAYLVTTGTPTDGESFYVDVWMPRSAWIKVGGTWATSTAGLVNESDEAEVDPDELAAVVYSYACDELAEHGTQGERGMWAQRRESARAAARDVLRWQREGYDDPTDARKLRSDALGGSAFSTRRTWGRWP